MPPSLSLVGRAAEKAASKAPFTVVHDIFPQVNKGAVLYLKDIFVHCSVHFIAFSILKSFKVIIECFYM